MLMVIHLREMICSVIFINNQGNYFAHSYVSRLFELGPVYIFFLELLILVLLPKYISKVGL